MSGRNSIMICRSCGVGLVVLACAGSHVDANVVISSQPTANMSCSGGFCEPTAPEAVLNVGDLQKEIAEFNNVTVETTGNGVEAHNMVIKTPFASPGGSVLNLLAHDAIRVDAHVTIGTGGQLSGLELVSGTGGTLGAISFGPSGRFSFGSTKDQFNINGGVFQLVNSLPALAKAIATDNGGGFFVLSDNYDAGKDGTYTTAPIGTTFTGVVEALGNSISNLKINATEDVTVGLFASIDGSAGFGIVRNLRIENASVEGSSCVGAIAGTLADGALLEQSSATGTVVVSDDSAGGGLVGSAIGGAIDSSWSAVNVTGGDQDTVIGGLAGYSGTITNSWAAGRVKAGEMDGAGGLIGENEGAISGSFATGNVEIAGTNASDAGGLVGVSAGSVTNSYAMGAVRDTGGGGSTIGGLIGITSVGATTTSSYSTGAPAGVESDDIGGSVGFDASGAHSFRDVYWDVTTSHVSQGAGNRTNVGGITPLTSGELRSGLPDGFRKSVWSEIPSINRGFPWLIANPPAK